MIGILKCISNRKLPWNVQLLGLVILKTHPCFFLGGMFMACLNHTDISILKSKESEEQCEKKNVFCFG